MGRYLARRLIQLIFVTLLVSTLLFVLLRLSGDPVLLMVGEFGTPEAIQATRKALGLDQPLIVQYFRFLRVLYTLNFGKSLVTKLPIMEIMVGRLKASLLLTLASVMFALLLSVPAGVFAAVKRRSIASSLVMAGTLLGQGIPGFWLGLLLILLFSVQLHWFPSTGFGSWSHLVLPTVTLGSFLTAKVARLVRSEMLDALSEDYVRTAYAKGLPTLRVIFKHGLRNALLPVVTVLGIDLGQLLGGAVITETIFAWPGMGQWLILGVSNRDYPVVQAAIFIMAIGVVFINLIVDICYAVLDPRIKIGHGSERE